MHSEKCPVCEGSGYIHIPCDNIPCEKERKSCHGCNGKGWIEVGGAFGRGNC